MSKPPLTPGETAGADQLMAHAAGHLAVLARAVREGDKMHGTAQNTANFITLLRQDYSPAYLAALVVAAARQIGQEDPS